MNAWDPQGGRGMASWWVTLCIMVFAWVLLPRASGTVLTFEPYDQLTNAPAGTLPALYGHRVAGTSQDGFTYGSEGGSTPDIAVLFSTARLETDQINQGAQFGLRLVSGGWNHGASETALLAWQGDANREQMIRIQLRGTDDQYPVLRSLDLVGRGGNGSILPRLIIGDGQLTTLYAATQVSVPANQALTVRFDPPLKAQVLHVWVELGRNPPPVGLDNLVFGQAQVVPSVWVADTVYQAPAATTGSPFISPTSLTMDAAGQPWVAWTEAQGTGTAWWARREGGSWQTNQITRFSGAPVFLPSAGKGPALVSLSSNEVPYLYHMTVRYSENQPPSYFLARMDLDSTPQGPAANIEQVPVAASLTSSFDVDGRASHPPDHVTFHDRGVLRWNGVSALTTTPANLGFSARVRFRQGPERQIHVLYQTDDGALHYNGGGADRDRVILMGNSGSCAYSLAVDPANGIHVAAAEGSGRFFFGAVGQLAYLHSLDGLAWSTNRFTGVPADVGATAIALDAHQRPAIAFTRGFRTLYFTRFDGQSWTPPTLIRESLGGWDFSRDLQLAFDAANRPQLLVADHLTRRLLLLSPMPESTPADLRIADISASTPRAAVGTQVRLSVTLTNAGPRNATAAQLRLRLAPELLVRDLDPRPSIRQASTVSYNLGTLQAFEARTLRLTISSSDPTLARVEAMVASEVQDSDPTNDFLEAAPVVFLTAPCVANPEAPGCDGMDVFPAIPPPALANQPWSLPFRFPLAPLGSELRVSASTPLPSDFCLTADGELRGTPGGAGPLPLELELAVPGGRVWTFQRDLPVVPAIDAPEPNAFWSLDGHGWDSVGGAPASLGTQGTFVGGAVGTALQVAWDALNDPRTDLARPDILFAAPPLFTNVNWGRGPVTVTAWMRRDDGALSRGDARRYGFVIGLANPADAFDSRYVAFDPANGRLNLLSGTPDFRAVAIPGPFLSGNTWYHLALVNDGPRVALYTNGVLAVSGQFNRGLPDRPLLSAGGESFGGAFAGAIDEIAVYRELLEPAAIAARMANPVPRRTPLPEGAGFPIAAMMREWVLPDAPQGEPYEAALAAAFCGSPVSIRLLHGALPVGLTLSPDGMIRGASEVSGLSRFRVRAVDARSSTAELAVALNTRPGLPAFALQPADQQVDAAGVLFLMVETRADASLQWFFNDRPLVGETGSVLALPDFSQGQVGRYRVRATNAAGTTWSREVRVGLRQVPDRPPTLDAAPVSLRPDGAVRIRIATLRGRIYELQRALDLRAALAGGWRTVQRFLANDVVGEVEDRIPGRPGAAFYRLVEHIPSAALPFSLEDGARLVGVADDGRGRPGLLPDVDPTSGRLGPFEYRAAGQALGEAEGLVLRLPQGAQPVNRDGAVALRFRQGELFFGEESPVQLDEGGAERVGLNATTDLELPAGPLTVEVLERLLGKPRGSGIGLTFFRHFRFTLLAGVFEGDRIRDARLQWADQAATRLPTPSTTSSDLALDIELSATRLRLPFHGEFSLADGTRSAARIVVSPNHPVWVELRPGPELSLSGRGQVEFENGPEFTVEFTFDDPVFRGSLAVKKLRLPEGLTLRNFLARIPRPSPPGPPPAEGARQLASLTSSPYLSSIQGAARVAALRSCASSASARQLLGEVGSQPEAVEDSAAAADEDEDEEIRQHFTEHALAELRAWACVAEAEGGWDRVPDPAYFRTLIERYVLISRSDTSSDGSSGTDLGAMTFAYRVAVLAEVAHVATLYPPEMADPTYLHFAVTDPRYNGMLNPPNPQLQPSVDWAFASVEELRGVDPSRYDTTTLGVAAKAIAKVIAAANRNSTVIPPARAEAMQRQFEEVLRARTAALERELNIESGRYTPEGNATVSSLKRYEAIAFLRKALRLHDALQRSGADTGVTLAPEMLSQLASQAWIDLKSQIVAITNQCTAPAYYRVLGAAAEISLIARVGDLLGLGGTQTALPTSEDITRYTSAMQAACLEAQPPVRLEDLYVQVDPTRVNEGRVLAVEGRMFWLWKLPTSLRTATPEVLEALRHAKEAFDPLFEPTALPLIEAFRPGLLLRTLRVGMMQDNIRRRFRLPSDPDWLNSQLPALNRVMKRRLKGANLESANRLLYLAAWRPRDNPARVGRRAAGATHQDRLRLAADAHDDAPDDLERRYAYLRAAIDGVEAEEQNALDLGDEAGTDRPPADLLSHLADMQLPGGLTVESAYGELLFHTGKRELSGNFRGQLQVPGAGLRLTLNRAEFSTGGAFTGELYGSLALPPDRPVATLSIPPNLPARLALARDKVPTLSGGGQLRLSNGATFDVFLSLEEPVYRLAASARGLRFQFTRAALEQLGVPLPSALDKTTAGKAIEYLTRTGLLFEGAQPPAGAAPTLDRLRPVETRPQPTDADDVAAGSAALWLLTRTTSMDSPAAGTGSALAGVPQPRAEAADREGTPLTRSDGGKGASPTRTGPLPPAAVEKSRNLLRLFTEQLSRASAALTDDTSILTQIAAEQALEMEPVPASEAEHLRRAKVAETARRLESFGRHFRDLTIELGTERGRELIGGAPEQAGWEAQVDIFVRAYRDALMAARNRLLEPVPIPSPGGNPWRPSEDWDRVAATNLIAAAQQYEASLAALGTTDAVLLQAGPEVGCSVFRVLLDERLESLGLDPVSGATADAGGLAVYLSLDHEQAMGGLQDLLRYEFWNQGTPFCQGTAEERLGRAVAAILQRVRDLGVQELHRGIERVASYARRPWEVPEFVESAVVRLLGAYDLPERLALTRYPEPTFAVTPRSTHEEVQDLRRDLSDLGELLDGAWRQLATLSQDEASGYPAELRRRRAKSLPEAGPLARVLARYGDIPALSALRTPLSQLATFEARLLDVESADPGFVTRMGRQTAGFVRRVLNAAAILDGPSSGGPAPARFLGSHPASVQTLTDTVLTRLQSLLHADPNLPWWVTASLAHDIHQASQAPWSTPATSDRLSSRATSSFEDARRRVMALGARTATPPNADLLLPGDVEVTRLFGGLTLNRVTRYVSLELGGRLDFPNVRTADGKTAFLELQRLRLESTGQFALVAATRVPLPFSEASFAGSFRASGDLPRRSMALFGEGTLTFLTPPSNPDSGQPFPTQLSASASYEPAEFAADGQPLGWRFAFSTSGAFRRSFGTDFALFGAGAGFMVGRSPEGNPVGGVTVGGSVGLFRKSDRRSIEPPAPSDFHVLVENAGVEIVGTVNGNGHAAVTNGTVKLPGFFYPVELPAELGCEGPGTRRIGTSASIQSPVRVSYTAGGRPRLEGTLRFSHFGIRLGGTNVLSNEASTAPNAGYAALTVCQADLGLDAEGRPFLDIPRAGLGFNIPAWDRGLLRVQNVHLGLDGRIQGELFLVEDFDLVRADGLHISLLGAPAYADPANRPPTGCQGTRLELDDVPGFAQPRVTVAGGVRVLFPADFLSNLDGTQAGGFFCGGIRIEPTLNGPEITAFVEELGLAGDFKLRQGNFTLRNARIAAGNFAGILNPEAEHPFYFAVSGDLHMGAFVFGLTDARILYRGLDIPPALGLGALRFTRDAATPLPAPFNLMPATIEFAELAFKRPSAPLMEMLSPENVKITASLRVGLPTLAKSFVGGGVSGVVFEFREDGTPIPPAIDGFDLTLASSADLKLPAFGDLSGKLRFGGLQRAIADPNNIRVEHIYAVGQLNGSQNGVKLGLLGAFNLIGPIGFCLDVNVGAAGIVLAPTPFQITGASGGVALLQTENPCDFTQYFEFDTATGTYRLKQNVELPPVGMPWNQFVESLEALSDRVEAFAGRFPHPAENAVTSGASTSTFERHQASPLATHESDNAETVSPGNASDPGQIVTFSSDGFAAFGCPEECPPRTVAILCQPHPDEARFPDRVIFKFSSISEDRLTNAPPHGLGLDPGAVRALGNNPALVGGEVANRLVANLRSTISVPSSLPAPVQSFLLEQERLALEGVRVVASNVVAAAARRAPDVYGAVRDELYRGMGCPDISLSLAGRMSMVGLSAFGWVEGRETTSFSGSGGVVGELHALGVPLGEARLFVSTTDANGLPNPSACGQIKASLGPLEFGQVDLALRCENCVVEFLQMFPAIVRAVGPAFLREVVEQVAPELESVAADPEAFLAGWQLQPESQRQAIAFGLLSRLAMARPELLPGNLTERLLEAFEASWDRIRPQVVLCGEVTPRLLGLPLTLGGRGVGLHFLGEKTGIIGEMAFAPSSLVPIFPPGDEASLSFAYRTTDTLTFLLRSLDGTLTRPESRDAFVREQVELLLENLILAARYQWHPLGLELGDAAVRILMPDFLNHPAFPGSTWRNPDLLGDPAMPTRDEVLVWAAASGKLGQAFDWLGTAEDFVEIVPSDDPRRDTAQQRRLDLRRTFFPHGGLVGGARMALPRLLLAAPSEWQPLYETAVHGNDLFVQAAAALRLIQEYVLRTETNGTAAFYTPAPNPPLLYDAQGRQLSADEIRARVVRQPDDFSADGLMRQLRDLDFSAPESLSHLYPDDLAFLRAEITNLTLFGVPVFGTARMTGKPSPLRVIDGAPLAHLDVAIDGESPVGKVAGGDFHFGFDIYSTPEQNLGAWARPLADSLQRQQQGFIPKATSTLASGAPGLSAAAALQRLANEIHGQLPRFAATNPLPPLNVVNLREWASGSGLVLANDEPGFGGSSNPRGSFRGSLPPASPPVLRAELALYAFSPFYDPTAEGDGPVVAARRMGGFAAKGRLDILPDLPGRSGSGQAELAITTTGTLPRLAGRIQALNLPTPFPGLTLQNAQAEFDSQGTTFLRASTSLPELGLGTLFRLQPLPPQSSLSAILTLSQPPPPEPAEGGTARNPFAQFLQTFSSRSALRLPAVRLSSDWVSGSLLLHGIGNMTNPVEISESAWSARASFAASATTAARQTMGTSVDPGGSLTLRATLGGTTRDVMRITGLPNAAFGVQGTGSGTFMAQLDAQLPGPLVVDVFPGTTVAGLSSQRLQISAPANGRLQFEFASDGSFLLEGALTSAFGGAAQGSFGAGARVRVDPNGATLSGNVGAATSTLQIGWYDGQISTRFNGQLSLAPLSALGGRVVLSGPDGGNLILTADASGTCVSGALLTLQDFATAPPVAISFPQFCLGPDRTFANVSPSLGPNPVPLTAGSPDLSVGEFVLEDLRALSLSGAFNASTVRLDFEANLKLGSLLNIPVRGAVGSEGIRFLQNVTSTRLLGFDFSQVRIGATNALGDLPDFGFVGRLPALPAALAQVDLAGRIPGSGPFSLLPSTPIHLPDFIPSFPLTGASPNLRYRPGSYDSVVRVSQPSGYWPLGDASGPFLDHRLAVFAGPSALHRRSGTAVGNVTRGEPGAFGPEYNFGIRVRGGLGYVRLDHEGLAPVTDQFSVSLWFRRTGSPLRATPATLAARGTQWSLAFREKAPGEGNRLQFGMAGLTAPGGGTLDWLYGRTRIDDTDWHHVVAVYDGAAEYLYLDGRLEAWQPAEGLVTPAANVPTTLGTRILESATGNDFNGWLDEVAIFSSALSPMEVLGQWTAGGRGGLALEGRLTANTIPGFPERALSGLLGTDGNAIVTIESGGTSEFAGVRFPAFRGTVLRLGGESAATFHSGLEIPQLDNGSLGSVHGRLEGSGAFAARASALVGRGVFGWNLRLTQLEAVGNWKQRSLTTRVTGDLTLPFQIASLTVNGELNTQTGQYILRGQAGGQLQFGSGLPFRYSASPELTQERFVLPGEVALGNQSDAASFRTQLEVAKNGQVGAAFDGLTDWVSFVGVGHGRLGWVGNLAYDASGFPRLEFRGQLGLAAPQHPEEIEDLPEGLGIGVSQKPRVTLSLRNPNRPVSVNHRGIATVEADPAFQGVRVFQFDLK